MDNCAECHKPSSSLFFSSEGQWFCRHCYTPPSLTNTCRLFERGHANPIDPMATTAHIRDIQARRLDTKTKKMYYDQGPKSHFFLKG